MPVHLVNWELNNEKPNYSIARSKFLAHLNRYPHIKDPGLDSSAFLWSPNGATTICNDLRAYLDSSDRLIVVTLSQGNHQGWLDRTTWNWIDSKI